MNKIDFVTIIFYDKVEMDLLKIQAHSFKYVDEFLINNIILMFNDKKELNEQFINYVYNELLIYYPPNLRDKIKIVFPKDINISIDIYDSNSNWFSQQLCKIQISNIIETDYYVVMDSKNHYINPISVDFFFNIDIDGIKPILYFDPNGIALLRYYQNGLDYFNVTCPSLYNNPVFKIQTTTPFVFIKEECQSLMSYIRMKENKPFDIFFMDSKLYTEFFFYFAYLIYKNNVNKYIYNKNIHPLVIVGPQPPSTCYYNTWEYKQEVLSNNTIYIFSLHRLAFYVINEEYKNNLLQFYKKTYKDDDMIIKHITTMLSS